VISSNSSEKDETNPDNSDFNMSMDSVNYLDFVTNLAPRCFLAQFHASMLLLNFGLTLNQNSLQY
jgi:hypothetical protein